MRNSSGQTAAGGLPRIVVVLGLVSLLNDAASEMIAPLLPVLLTATLGAGPLVVGLVEGVAQATASVLKLVSGRWTDRGARPRTLMLAGYGLSNLVRPLLGLAPGWTGVLLLRFLDRLGKGVRTTPRDALVAASVSEALRGSAFGFHRAMDHAGAILGPLAATALLAAGLTMQEVFLASVVPGIALMALIAAGVPRGRLAVSRAAAPPLRWGGLDPPLRALLAAVGVLAFASVPDAFLVLWAHDAGIPVVALPLLWAAAHLLRALAAGFGGALSDRAGRLPVVLAGWGGRVLLLVLLGTLAASGSLAWALFLAYCALTALTEPAETALVGDRAPAALRASALGLYHMLAGVIALPGALLFGARWQWSGRATAFLAAAAFTAAAGLMLVRARRAAAVRRPPAG
jgi:MFS family permease